MPAAATSGIGREIARGVEEGVRVAPLVPAEGVEVSERVHAGMEHVGLLRHVVDGIEQRVAVVRH